MVTVIQEIFNMVAVFIVAMNCLFFISPDDMNALIQKLDKNMIKWWLIYACLLVYFYFFSSPFLGMTIRSQSYSNFSIWYIIWLLVAALYHLPSSQTMGVDKMMNLSLFLTIFISSIFVLIFFHLGYTILWYIGLVSRVPRRRSEILTVLQNCIVLWTFGTSWSAPVGFGSTRESLDEVSPIYSLWATFIGLYIVNSVIERLTSWKLEEENEEKEEEERNLEFLDMVPWYSGTSADLFKTLFDLLVSVTVFLGRFDMRVMQAAMSGNHEGAKQEDFLYDLSINKNEFWFDFMADTGDGGNSSYSVARLLAQPLLEFQYDGSLKELYRGNLLLVGGDLAYPNPSPSNYEKRLFRPFEDALQPPSSYKKDHIAVNKPKLPDCVSELKQYDGPQCFVIPGNHDWLDGLQTFMRYICHKSWLGGWLMPQKKSYFALHLPNGWWVFGLDLALHNDIDSHQFKFFVELIQEKVKENDSVIVMTHAPNWILDSYWNEVTGKNVSHLICDHLKGRCKLRIAGDLHYYMRHSYVESTNPAMVQHLLVNGCGGAFLHPTHVFSNLNIKTHGTTYDTKSAYPSVQDSSKIAWGNILKFREKNWQFDFIGGFIYFMLTFSMFPLCKLDHILEDDTFSGHLKNFFSVILDTFLHMVGESYVSFVAALLLLMVAILFVPSKVSKKKRVIIGVVHVSAHLVSALVLMLLMELVVQICIRNNLLATSGYHSLYKWYRTLEREYFPDPTGLRVRIEQWTFGLYPACIKYLLSAFDVPEVMAVTRTKICKNGMVSLSRGSAIIYYASVFIYFWVLSTPVVSLIFGIYLYICINWLHLHFDEAFSSLRIADYKSFTRFHITKDGNLEIFTLAVDKVPKEWKIDSDWEKEFKQHEQELSHQRKYPSKWRANPFDEDPINTVKIVDHFVIQKDKAMKNLHVAENHR